MATETYDVVVIGGGPGGYVAAIRAAQLGLRTACVEKRGALGGTCLNVGCIPSKALLQSSHLYEEAAKHMAPHGIKVSNIVLDLAAMLARKEKVVVDLTKGVEFLFKQNKVAYVKGAGRLLGGGKIAVALNGSGEQTLEAKNIIIATGSDVMPLPGVTIDEKQIVSSTGALSLAKVPAHMVVVGGGYIGLEMGSVWRRLGAKVTVVEFLDRIVPGMDGEIAKAFQRVLAKQGMAFRLGTKVTGAKANKTGVTLTLEPAAGGKAETLEADVVLVAIGRRPYSDGLGLEAAGVAIDNKGRVQTDGHWRTNVPGVFAIGDVIAGPMLAHKAEEEGVAVAEIIAGQAGHVNYETVPGIVYTWPEVATVGRTEEELKAAGIEYKTGKFPFTANSRARCNADTDGFVKVLADSKTDRVLGVHIIGPDAGTMIHECIVAMEFGGSAEDLARSFHGHPTLNEAVKEAALGVGGRAIHI
ncbi:MAG TPA: dihydrolipoyl dehydrogenase [Dongiaceae bacterium]|jgi:dihydrolipoamide dehydrogenase